MKIAFLLLIASTGAFGQQLAEFFETKNVVVKIDMPATQQGVDVYPQRTPALDLKSYQGRLKKYGTAVRSGDSIMVTKVLVKAKNIEFQLGGGGYGTMWDDTDESVQFTPTGKSGREKDLEDRIRNESDANRRRSLERELDDARRERERRNDRDRAAAEQASVLKRDRIEGKRLQGGSRFNIRYEPSIPSSALTAEAVMAALADYVTFPGVEPKLTAAPPPSSGSVPSPPAEGGELQKGMTKAQVEARYGEPVEMNMKNQDGLKLTQCTYKSKGVSVQAEFVNDVLVRYSISSN